MQKLYNLIGCLFVVSTTIAQNCSLPILSSIDQVTTESAELSWIDFNNADSYEIEHGKKGFARTGNPTLANILEETVTLTALESGLSYEVYLRTVCDNQILSEWNGPYFFNTVIDNDASCQLNLSIPDNNCPSPQSFAIELTTGSNATIGQGITLEALELSIAHDWPPDLYLELVSPQGTRCILSSFNGDGVNDYGDSADPSCMSVAKFTDEACVSVESWVPPFVGSFHPEQNMNEAFFGEPIDGIWTLDVCDRAQGDLGFLSYVKLLFNEEACTVPRDFRIIDIEGDRIKIKWNTFNACQVVKISYKKLGAPNQDFFFDFVECGNETFEITGLDFDTEYELFISAQCGTDSESANSCLEIFRTACDNSRFSTSFDNLSDCDNLCDSLCLINEVWNNSDTDHLGWSIRSASTSTEFTGPSNDVSGNGLYLFTESSNLSCNSLEAILESTCLNYNTVSNCGLSFYYHMYGNDIGRLMLEVKTNNIWETVWEKSGDQGDQWFFENVSLASTFQRSQLRFRSELLNGRNRGDIAIDNIKLIGLDTIELRLFYTDMDNDGFGDPDMPVFLCAETAPVGYTENSDDCDDNNALVNPSAQEIRCNLIDDNCNGNSDDTDIQDLDYTITSISNETCQGESNGRIELEVFNGLRPYSFLWSNGDVTENLDNASSGVYTCTISDFGGCQIVTDPIFMPFDDKLVYSIESLTDPSCFGLEDGSVSLLYGGGIPPYRVDWSNGLEGENITGLSTGTYQATVTDAAGCQVVTDSIYLEGRNALTTGVMLKRDIDCRGGRNGFIQLGVSGGQPPYDFLWSNNETESIIRNLYSGSYTVTITDNRGCASILQDIEVKQPDSLEINVTAVEHVTCAGGRDGMIDLRITGGSAPYSFFWSNGSNREDLINVESGIYSLTITDINACQTAITNIIVNEPEEIDIQILDINAVDCIGSDDGSIEVDVSGGQLPYLYNWSVLDGQALSEGSLDQLSSGNYSLTVVDQFGCKSTPLNFEIENRNVELQMNVDQFERLVCFGDSTAALHVSIANGIEPYDYNWSNGTMHITTNRTDTITDLISGSYNLTITDGAGCVGISDSILVVSPEEILYSVRAKENNPCFDSKEGRVSIDVEGGTGSYSTVWSNGERGFTISDLEAGSYMATITDENDCIVETSEISIDSPEPIMLDADILYPVGSNKGSISLSIHGGIPPYILTWDSPIAFEQDSLAQNLDAGKYSVTITDDNGCELDTFFVLDIIDGTSNLIEEGLTIYPNPTNDFVYVTSDNSNITALTLFNLQSELLYTERYGINRKAFTLDLSNYPRGIYLLKIQTESGNYLTKILRL